MKGDHRQLEIFPDQALLKRMIITKTGRLLV